MTRKEAKEVLLRYRPGAIDAIDPEMREALEAARGDSDLGEWLQQHEAFQEALRAKFRQLEPPPGLRERLLARQRVVRPPATFWRPVSWKPVLAAAAALVILGATAVFWPRPEGLDEFAQFRQRMVGTALRQYAMDLKTPDMAQLRGFLAQGGAPSDYEVPAGLARRQLTGGGLLKWRSQPVSMVCFDRGDSQMLFLFVAPREAVREAPGSVPQVTRREEVVTVSWTANDRIYVLAGPDEPDFVSKYL